MTPKIEYPGSGLAPCYAHYPGQTSPQPVYVYLDCADGRMGIESNAAIGGGAPMEVYHGHVQRWTVQGGAYISAQAAHELLDEIAPLAERVMAGYSSEWDGSNHRASFTADAQTAIDEIDRICSEWDGERDQVWDAGDWLQGVVSRADDGGWEIEGYGRIDAHTDDATLTDMAVEIGREAAQQGILLPDLDYYLDGLRDRAS
jgi:hypothetical protein